MATDSGRRGVCRQLDVDLTSLQMTFMPHRLATARKPEVDYHGADKSTGHERVWPNEITHEFIRANEYPILRCFRTMPPQHDCILPFTLFVIGPGAASL